MQNLPNITSLEIAVVSAAVAVLYVAPAALELLDARRRRRLARQRAAVGSLPPMPETPYAVPPNREAAELTSTAPDAVGGVASPIEVEQTAVQSEERDDGMRSGVASIVSEPVPAAPEVPLAAPAAQGIETLSVEIQPLEGPARYRLRLDALHRALLPEWPPDAVRRDPDRSRVWQEAQVLVEAQWTRIGAVTLGSPYPIRSQCLGSSERTGSTYRLHFLLFPVLWPFAESQAVAQAVLEVEAPHGVMRGWVDALREPELSEDHRRAIHELSGSGS